MRRDWLSCSTPALNRKEEDDGTIFQFKNGIKHHFAPGDLVQPLGSIETLMGVGGLYGSLNTVQGIWLQSKTPILEEDVAEALRILSCQIPHLQFCLARRGWRLWFRRIRNFKVDFQTSTDDAMEVYEQLLESKYSFWTGPLWKVRLVFPNANVECGDKKGEFSAALIFSIQHCITDGTANMKICREIVQILNKLSEGHKVVPKLAPLSPTIDNTLKGVPPVPYLTKYFCRKFLATMIKNFYHISSFEETLPVPATKVANTRVLYDDMSIDETKNIIKLCKAANITVHSCIVTAANFALLEVAQGYINEPLGPRVINVTHCVNMRRYFQKDFNDTSGCHISFTEDKSRMSLPESQDFLNQAKMLHQSMKDHLEVGKEHLKIVPILQLASMLYPANCFLTRKGYKNKTDCHYVTTNMGNLKDLLPGPKENENIEIAYMLRSVSSQLAGNPFILTFHTFRDRFMISMDYYTNKMKDETARNFFFTLCQYIRNLADHGTLYSLQKS